MTLPTWVEWIHCNAEGQWYGTKDEPFIVNGQWVRPRTGCIAFSADPIPNYKCRRVHITELLKQGCDVSKVRCYMRDNYGAPLHADCYNLTVAEVDEVVSNCKQRSHIPFFWYDNLWSFNFNSRHFMFDSAIGVRGFKHFVFANGYVSLTPYKMVNGTVELPVAFERTV